MLLKEAKKSIQERWNERVANILDDDFIFSSKYDKVERIKRAKSDYAFFCREYFPKVARCECGKFQIDAANYLKKHHNTRMLSKWARGHAKSTHFSCLIPLWLKIQDNKELHVMVIVSKSEESAIGLLSDLQAELQYNQRYIQDFGEQVTSGDWAEGSFSTRDGVFFRAIGRGQSPRGLKKNSRRPDYIVCDDIDDDELVRNEKRVKIVCKWVFEALLGTMDMGEGRFIIVGNKIAKNSVIAYMEKRPKIYHTTINALDKNGQPTWKEKYTFSQIAELREFMTENSFQKEYMNNPITEGSVFREKYIRFGKMLALKQYRSLVCYCDPSFRDSSDNDFKATVLLGKTKEGHFHVIKVYADQTSVSNMVGWHYDVENYVAGEVPVRYYMEANFIQDLLLKEFEMVGNALGHQIPIIGDRRKKPDKFARIEALQPLFERGFVLLNEAEAEQLGMRVLVDQLLSFERGSRSHDDAPDALEGAIFKLSRYDKMENTAYRVGERPSRSY